MMSARSVIVPCEPIKSQSSLQAPTVPVGVYVVTLSISKLATSTGSITDPSALNLVMVLHINSTTVPSSCTSHSCFHSTSGCATGHAPATTVPAHTSIGVSVSSAVVYA